MRRRSELSGMPVVVVGLGRSGRAAAALLKREGAQVTGVDERTELPDAERLRADGVELSLGSFSKAVLARAGLVVLSPGVPPSHPALQAARAAGVEMVGEVELAWRLLPPAPILGITGTNGKSTTTALCGEMLREAGLRVFVGGNLGTPFSEAVFEEGPDAYVLELSSFQLEGVSTMRVRGAAILNLTPDHLDRHPDAEAYGNAKARIFLGQQERDFAVVNAEDEAVMRLAARAKGPVHGFRLGLRRSVQDLASLARGDGSSFTLSPAASTERGPTGPFPRFELRNRALRGDHNLRNAMAAALLAKGFGLSDEAIQRGLDGFGGLPHRLESVRVVRGVEWVNDSKATNVASTGVALRALEGRIWLVAGGRGKGASYAPLVTASGGKLAGLLTIGEDAKTLEAAFARTCPVHPCETLENAVAYAHEKAVEGDVVLLSPACASYDQFRSFEHRGDVFRARVRALTE